MKQVFISNGIAIQATAGAYDALGRTVGGSATVEDFGFWSVTGSAYLDGSTAALSLLNAGVFSANANQFQLVSAQTTGNPIASPIIHSKDVTRVRYEQNVAPVKHAIIFQDVMTESIAIGDPIVLRLNVRFPGDVAFYEAQINPSAGVTGTAINAALDSPQKVYSVEVIAEAAVGAGSDTSAINTLLNTAINADSTMSKLVTATTDTDVLTLTANMYGMIIDASITVDGASSGTTVTETAMVMGCGSFFEALSEEKKAAYAQGFLNRMYFPTGGETFASKATGGATANETVTYDRFTIEYNSSTNDMPGFNGQGVGNQAVIYWPAAANTTTGAAMEACIDFTVDTDVEFSF
mgnify:FL=1|tara:strand:- start:380 stop:1432 length:1053 start_codon:yes stop_codon:yes gene_type:complete